MCHRARVLSYPPLLPGFLILPAQNVASSKVTRPLGLIARRGRKRIEETRIRIRNARSIRSLSILGARDFTTLLGRPTDDRLRNKRITRPVCVSTHVKHTSIAKGCLAAFEKVPRAPFSFCPFIEKTDRRMRTRPPTKPPEILIRLAVVR